MKLGRSGVLALFGMDGRLIMRDPFDPAQIGRVVKPVFMSKGFATAREGEYQTKSVIDGIERLYHYQKIGSFALVGVVALSLDDIYADWRRKAAVMIAILSLSCAIITALALILKKELRLRTAAEAAMDRLARIDSLTGIANRRQFDEALEQQWQIALQHQPPCRC